MRLTLEGEREREKLPEGQVLTAEITSVKEVEKPWIDNKTGEKAVRIAFEFTILDDKYAGRKVWQDLFPSFYVSDRCWLYNWTLKILGREELPEGFTLDTSAFEGARVPIVLYTRTYTKKNGEEGSSLDVSLLSEQEAASLRASGATLQDEVADTSEATDTSSDQDDLIEPF